MHTTIRQKDIVLFHLIFLLCITIQPKIRVHTNLFLLFAHDHSTKVYGLLSFILSLCTTIRPKIRVLINLLFLFAHDHLTKVRSHSYSEIYSFLNCANVLFVALPLYFDRYNLTLIFGTL